MIRVPSGSHLPQTIASRSKLMQRMTEAEFWAALGRKQLNYANLDLSGLDLPYLNMASVDFINCNLRDINFTGSRLMDANFTGSNLSGANFTDADLAGATLAGNKLDRVIGLASKEEEMAEAQRILNLLEDPRNQLMMDDWHTCETSHCLAGWSCPHLHDPSPEASRKLPTLTKYFFEYSNTFAFAALVRVAKGKESIWSTEGN